VPLDPGLKAALPGALSGHKGERGEKGFLLFPLLYSSFDLCLLGEREARVWEFFESRPRFFPSPRCSALRIPRGCYSGQAAALMESRPCDRRQADSLAISYRYLSILARVQPFAQTAGIQSRILSFHNRRVAGCGTKELEDLNRSGHCHHAGGLQPF
jgi:hypothetical protein